MSTATQRQAAWRQRQRAGKICLLVEVDEVALVDKLIEEELLRPEYADDAEVGHATEKVLQLFIEGILK